MTTPGKTADLLRPVLADLGGVVAHIGSDSLHRGTPCAEMDVEALRRHVLGWLTVFAEGFADSRGQAPADDSSAEVPEGAAAGAALVGACAQQLDDAVRGGAADRPLSLGSAAMPGDLALSMVLWEYLVHGWDLARATGQTWSPSWGAAEASLAFAPGMLTDDYQGAGKAFGPRVAVAPDASPFDRLLGLSGRDPGWSPA